jgi:hypothetical protein
MREKEDAGFLPLALLALAALVRRPPRLHPLLPTHHPTAMMNRIVAGLLCTIAVADVARALIPAAPLLRGGAVSLRLLILNSWRCSSCTEHSLLQASPLSMSATEGETKTDANPVHIGWDSHQVGRDCFRRMRVPSGSSTWLPPAPSIHSQSIKFLPHWCVNSMAMKA